MYLIEDEEESVRKKRSGKSRRLSEEDQRKIAERGGLREGCEMISFILPKKIEERSKEVSEKLGISDEELMIEALSQSQFLNLDTESKAEIHSSLSEKYLKEAEEFLEKGDYVQASEKAWGAASQIVKALAAERGKELRSHGELHKFVAELRNERGDAEISTLWASANSLHQNFYENWLPAETVKDLFENVKKFVEKLKR